MTAVVLAFDLLLFYCQTAFGSGFSSSEANIMHQMFHIIGVKIPQFFRFFSLQVHASVETWYFIFHSGLWMSSREMLVHMQPAARVLWSAWPRLITNGEQLKEISRDFMGIGTMAELPNSKRSVNVHWRLCLFKQCYGVKCKRNNNSDDDFLFIHVLHLSMPNKHHITQ